MPNARIVRSSSRVATVLIVSTALFACDGAAPDDLHLLVLGGTVIDTAPSYGRSEAFVGQAVQAIGAAEDLFLATKVNVQDRGTEAALGQMEASSATLGKRTVDLMQVWNLGDNFRSLSDRYLSGTPRCGSGVEASWPVAFRGYHDLVSPAVRSGGGCAEPPRDGFRAARLFDRPSGSRRAVVATRGGAWDRGDGEPSLYHGELVLASGGQEPPELGG